MIVSIGKYLEWLNFNDWKYTWIIDNFSWFLSHNLKGLKAFMVLTFGAYGNQKIKGNYKWFDPQLFPFFLPCMSSINLIRRKVSHMEAKDINIWVLWSFNW